MPDFVFDYVYRPSARTEFAALNPADQAEISRLVESLCRDPGVDNQRKFVLYREPETVYLYDDTRWSLTYRIVDQSVIEIRAIARARGG